MAILTRAKFASIAKTYAGNHGLRGIVNETRTFSKSTSVTSIFLSHSHLDKDVVEQAKIFFENLGISIYVDWADKSMPEHTNGETAQKIKNQIILNDKFIFLATNSAIASKWCNWEVGIGDTYKYHKNKLAILPLADNSGNWNGNEYLQIYPRIEQGNLSPDDYYIWLPDQTVVNIKKWLSS